MNRTCARLFTLLYPRGWRERYGVEFQAILEMNDDRSSSTFRAGLNVIWSAFRERIFPTRGRTMDQTARSFTSMLKRPSAFLPMAMSLLALAIVLSDLALYGIPSPGGDEGAVAHLWQLLMAGQLPIICFFAVKWLRRAPRQTFSVLSLQAGAVLAACAPVFFLNL